MGKIGVDETGSMT